MKTVTKEPAGTGKTGQRKWLSRLGTFLMMGGWLLVLFLVLGIIILISVLTS